MAFKSILAAQRRSFITLVIFALISITHAQTVWDGTSSTTWYTGDGPYTISTPADLAGLASLVNSGNNFAGKTINLVADIELNDTTGWKSWGTSAPTRTWVRIGTSTTAQQFQGIFNGNSYIVSGIYISNSTTYQGLFGYIGANGIIKNLGIAASYVKGGDDTGGMIGRNNGQVSNSYSIGTMVTAGSSNDVGGLIGGNGGSVNNCYSTGLVTGGGSSYGGGLVGYTYSGGTVSNSYYDKTTSGRTDTGKGEGKTTSEMQTQDFADALNFSAGLLSANEWQYNFGNYPTLENTLASNPLDGKFGNNNAGTTESNPYVINTVTHLKNLSNMTKIIDFKGYFFKLGQNIAFLGGDNPFTAIGSNTKPFNGTFDGDNKTISNVSISGATYQGLFGYIGANGTLKNLGVTGSTVQGTDYVGGLAGYLIAGAKINDSYFSGTVTGTGDNVGGLAGFNAGAIRGSHSAGTVTGGDDVGGLVGYTGAASTIGGSYSNSTVTGDNEVGGLVGNNVTSAKIDTSYSTGAVNGEENDLGGLVGVNGGTISNSYSTSTVTIEEGFYVGGLAGTNNGTINNSYSTGAVNGDMTVGGLVGRNSGSAVIYSSYSIGKVTGSDYLGGLAGTNASTAKINNSYYDKTVNSTLADPRNEGKTTTEMKAALFVRELNSIAAFISMKKWVIGAANNGYPTISNEAAEEDIDFFFAGGDGTEETPYLITTPTHLKNIPLLIDFGKSFTGKYLKLVNDIDISAISNWTPIGTYNGGSSPISKPFLGTFDGNGKIISNVKIDVTSGNAQGLFGFLGANGTIKNLGATGDIKGTGADVGGLVGYAVAGAKIENSYFSGAVIGTGNFTGGLVGFNGGAISGSYSTGTVVGTQYTGGFAGGNQPGTIINSYSTSTVTGTSSVGGFVGRTSNGGWIDKSYSTGAVTGTGNMIGGFVGENGYPIKNSYSTGTVNGTGNSVGGFVGKNTSATISNNYSTGAVNGAGNGVGGFVGENNGTGSQINSSYSIGLVTGTGAATNIGGFIGNYTSCTSCTINSGYYDKTVNSTLADPGNEGKNSADMKIQGFVDELNNIAGLLNMSKWVINSGTNNGYPTLSTEDAPATNIAPFFAGGNGTEEYPYLITTPEHLKNVSRLVDLGINFQGKFIKLGNDIALNDTENWESWDVNPPANSWARIGASDAKAFQGTFDGNGKVISGLYTTSASDGVGLFGNIGANGSVKNLGIIDSYIIGTGSYFYYAGGITGNNRGIISNCYSKANVKTTQYGGGIAGDNYGTITNSYSTGKVNGTNNLGGLVGRNNYSTSYGTGKIENSYSTGLVTGTSSALGGLVGNFVTNSIITNSYYDKTVNSALTDPRSEGKTTEEMKLQTTFVDWDFANTWSISGTVNNGYPDLKWSACSVAGGAWENGACKLPGVFPTQSLVFNTTYTSTLTLGDLPLHEHNGYAWSEPTDTRLFAGDNQHFEVAYTAPSGDSATAYGNIVVNVAKATDQAVENSPHITISGTNIDQHERDLSIIIALKESEHGDLTYAPGTFTDGAKILTAKPEISADGHTLTFTGTGKTSGTATLEITVKSQNYGDVSVTITFEATSKMEVAISGITKQDYVFDGNPKSGYTGTPTALPYEGTFIYKYAGTGYPESTTKPTNAGTYTISVSVPPEALYTGEWENTFVIAQADDPTYTIPSGLTVTVGQTLANVTPTLSGGWAWADATTVVVSAGTHKYSATFTPSDAVNYKTLRDVELTVQVSPAETSSSSSDDTPSSSSSSDEPTPSSSSSDDTPSSSSSSEEPTPSSSSADDDTPIRNTQLASRTLKVQTIGNYIVLENLPQNARVEVYNLQGKRIHSPYSENSQILRILVQTKGVYVVKVANQTLRVVVR